MKIGKYFTLEELTVSETAARRGIPNEPNLVVLENLRMLTTYILDPLREELGVPIVVTSGFRSSEVNALIGGSPTSQHVLGQAADIIVPGVSVLDVCLTVQRMSLPFDQLIDEFSKWTHVSYASRHRREFLVARRVNGKTTYRRK